jgi:hypothetical protein
MATIQRPVKTYGNRTYVAEVAAAPSNEDPILASEVDGDLDTIYAAWNAGADTVNIKDGSVTYAKLAPDAQLWRDTGSTLTPGVNYTNRPIVAGTGNAVAFLWGSTTVKNRLKDVGATGLQILSNSDGINNDNAALSSWMVQLNPTNDVVDILRSPAGATSAFATLSRLSSDGSLTVGTQASGGTPKINLGNRMALESWEGGICTWYCNDSTTVGYNAALPGWKTTFDYRAGGNATIVYHPAGGAYGPQMTFDTGGSFTITGSFGVKATGTTWSNPSDRRLKDEIEDYPTGLAAILQLKPRTFVFNGKGGSQAGMRGYGFIADEVVPAMPETVRVRAGKLDPDDEDETDIQMLDQSNLILALVNAMKELAGRVTALEG